MRAESVFCQPGAAFFFTQPDGTIRLINDAAADLLEVSPAEALDLPCWTIARLEGPTGGPHCGPDCPFRRLSSREGMHGPLRLSRRSRDGGRLGVELMALSVAGRDGLVSGVLHLLTGLPTGARPETSTEPLHQWWVRGPSALGLSDAASTGPQYADSPRPVMALSRREMEVLDLIAADTPTKEVARLLFISPHTVHNHVRSILKKLGVHSRIGAVVAWRLLGTAGAGLAARSRPPRPEVFVDE